MCLTLEQAIVEAYMNSDYDNIYKDMKAVLFLGTPHRGSDLAMVLEHVLRVSFSRRKFVSQLSANSESIKEINEHFSRRVEAMRLISFFETNNTRLPRKCVFPRLHLKV
jgi:hypothetical protein